MYKRQIQTIFKEYEDKYQVKAFLIDEDGNIQISTDKTGYEKANLFSGSGYEKLKESVLGEKSKTSSWWYSEQENQGYLVTQYIPNLDLHLVVENDITQARCV